MGSNPDIGLLMAFTAGMISFLSPCILPLIPGYLSFISGISVDQLGQSSGQGRVRVLTATILFVIGFALIFVGLGASAGLLGIFLLSYKAILTKVAGVIIIIFALFTMGIIRIPQLYGTKRFQVGKNRFGVWGALPLGMAFGFAWTPCVGPILGSIFMVATTSDTINQGTLLLSVYTLGLGIPFIATALFFNSALGAFRWVKRNYRVVNIISGLLLMAMGILVLTGKLSKLIF
ncbi:MAG: cytochrome c biogenesis protein CcdA [Actinobacteria bacterium]|nr:cytochrome c biogenesis protein CcdA [Actinomycetota bacterium]